jgi:hypothetical protein
VVRTSAVEEEEKEAHSVGQLNHSVAVEVE